MSVWIVLIVGGLITFAIRLSFLAGAGRLRLSATLQRLLRFVPVSVLTALIVPDLFYRQGQLVPLIDNHRLWAGLVAIAVAWITRNTFLTIGAGMGVLILLQALLPSA